MEGTKPIILEGTSPRRGGVPSILVLLLLFDFDFDFDLYNNIYYNVSL